MADGEVSFKFCRIKLEKTKSVFDWESGDIAVCVDFFGEMEMKREMSNQCQNNQSKVCKVIKSLKSAKGQRITFTL